MSHQAEHSYVVKFDSTAGGSLVDYSDDVRAVTLPDIANNFEQYHTGDSRAPKTTVGGYTGGFTVDVVRDPDSASFHSVLMAMIVESSPAARSIQIDLPDSSAGSERHAAEVHLQRYNPGPGRGGSGTPATGQAQFMITGSSYTRSIISS